MSTEAHNTGAGIDLTAMLALILGADFRNRLGNDQGYRITLMQNGQTLCWLNLKSISRLTLQVTGWGEVA